MDAGTPFARELLAPETLLPSTIGSLIEAGTKQASSSSASGGAAHDELLSPISQVGLFIGQSSRTRDATGSLARYSNEHPIDLIRACLRPGGSADIRARRLPRSRLCLHPGLRARPFLLLLRFPVARIPAGPPSRLTAVRRHPTNRIPARSHSLHRSRPAGHKWTQAPPVGPDDQARFGHRTSRASPWSRRRSPAAESRSV